MEKFFTVTEGTRLHDEYFTYKTNHKLVNQCAKDFMEKHNMETEKFARSSETFCIIPTENDCKNFGSMFSKDKVNGLSVFKKNSEIGKDWIKTLKLQNLCVLHKPMIAFEFSKFAGGKFTTRLFDIDGILYLSFDCGYEVETPEGFNELKASEFFKIIEDYDARQIEN